MILRPRVCLMPSKLRHLDQPLNARFTREARHSPVRSGSSQRRATVIRSRRIDRQSKRSASLGRAVRSRLPTPGRNRLPKAATYFAHLKGYRFRSASPPDEALNEKGPNPFEPGPSSHVVVELLLDLRLPRLCRRPIAFTETLAASAIPPLDETRSQVIAPAIAANQLV
jgi:hypothetical protein